MTGDEPCPAATGYSFCTTNSDGVHRCICMADAGQHKDHAHTCSCGDRFTAVMGTLDQLIKMLTGGSNVSRRNR